MKRGFAIRLPFRLETQGLLCTAVLGAVGFVVLYPLLLLILNSMVKNQARWNPEIHRTA